MARSTRVASRRSSRLLVLVGLLVGVVAGMGPGAEPASAQAATYTNPAIPGLSSNPFIVKSGSTYYAYLNGFDFYLPFPVMAYSSTDLSTWTQVGNVLGDAGAWADDASGFNVTSPSVINVPSNPAASRWLLYYSAKRTGSTQTCIGVATASSPAGPFTGRAQPLICPSGGAKDPSAMNLGAAPPYQQLIYRRSSDGAIYNQVLSPDGLSLLPDAQTPFELYRPQPGWWQNGVVERPAVTVVGSDIYLFFSAGTANTAGRAIGWSKCTQGFGIVNGCFSPTHLGTFISGTGQVQSPSGMQVFSDGTNRWIAYDGLPAGSCPSSGACSGTRSMRIDKLCFAHGQPRTNAPSTGAQSLSRSTNCSADIPGRAIAPQPVTSDAPLREPDKVAFRDGGASAPVRGRLHWLFSDTLQSGCSVSNSSSIGVPHASATGPTWTSEPLDANGCARQWVPLTAEEVAYDQTHRLCTPSPTCDGKRMALWEQGLFTHPDGYGIGFFLKLIHDGDNDGEVTRPDGTVNEDGNGDGYADEGCAWCYEFVGTGAVRIESGQTVVNRSATSVACNPTCLFDIPAFGGNNYSRPFVDGTNVYLTTEGFLARAPMSQVLTRSAWRFWTTGGWSANEADADPVPGIKDPADDWDGGFQDVSYNPYLDRWINVVNEGFPEWNKLKLQTATSPEGPWSSEVLAYDAIGQACAPAESHRPYGFLHANSLARDGGRTLSIVYARPGPRFGLDPACPGQVRMLTLRLG
jgi:hypothetical protein